MQPILAERSSSGLIQFESVAEAMEALTFCNHVSIPNPSKFLLTHQLLISNVNLQILLYLQAESSLLSLNYASHQRVPDFSLFLLHDDKSLLI